MNYEILAPIIVSILGWMVVDWLSVRRDKKKEWRDISRNTVKLVDMIEEKSINYHTSQERNTELENELIKDIAKLDMHMQLIKYNLKMKDNIYPFRAAITLKNFQTVNFTTQTSNSEIIRLISFNATKIKEALYTAK